MISILDGKTVKITATMLVLTFQFYATEDLLLVSNLNGDIIFLFFMNIHRIKTNELVDFYQATELTTGKINMYTQTFTYTHETVILRHREREQAQAMCLTTYIWKHYTLE